MRLIRRGPKYLRRHNWRTFVACFAMLEVTVTLESLLTLQLIRMLFGDGIILDDVYETLYRPQEGVTR